MTQAPTALNKRGRKVVIDGYKFDSQKEADFYTRFVRDSGMEFSVHPKFEILESFSLYGRKIQKMVYTPDFVIYDDEGKISHVFDVKNGFSEYAVDAAVKLRFKLFSRRYHYFVECVIVRTHDFKTHTFFAEPAAVTHLHKTINY